MGIIFALIAIAAGTYLGFHASMKYSYRECVLRDTITFLENIKGQIGYLQKPLDSIIFDALSIYESGFYDVLKGYYMLIKGGKEVNVETLNEVVTLKQMPQNVNSLYVQLFESLGKSRADFQLEQVEEYKRSFDKIHSYSLSEKNKFSSVYKKVGVLCGIGLAVIFI